MLDRVPGRTWRRRVFRLTRELRMESELARHGLNEAARADIAAALAGLGYATDERALLDTPFRRKRQRWATRFSDGSFPVFYSSLDAETAQAEVRHWGPSVLAKPSQPRTAYYRLFHCMFHGVAKDLRPCREAWADLVHKTDYAFCNRIGAEAIQLGLDGLVTWSARRPEGANLPVFSRASLRDSVAEELMALTYEPADRSVSLRPV